MNLSHSQSLARDMFMGITPVLLLGWVAGIALFPVLGNVVSQGPLLVWLVLHSGLYIVRIRHVRLVKDRLEEGEQTTSDDFKIFALGTFLSGCAWGSLVLFLSADQAVLYHILTFAWLSFVCLFGMIAYSAVPWLQFALSLPAFAPLAVWSLSQSEAFYLWSGALIVSYFLIQAFQVVVNARVMAKSFTRLELQEQKLGEVQTVNRDLMRRAQSGFFSEQELARDRQLFIEGPVVMYRCKAKGNWPLERISSNIAQFGYDSAVLEAREQGFADLIHAEDVHFVREEELRFRRGHMQGVRLEYRLLCAAGHYCWVYDYTVPVYDEHGELTHLDGYLLDISRVYEANEALAKEKERAQVTLESIGDAVITTNNFGRIEFMNSVAEQLTGWTYSLARFGRLSEVFRIREGAGAPWIDDPIQFFLQCPDLTEGRQKEAELYSRQGMRALVTYNAAPIRTHSDEVVGYVLVFLDITDKVGMQRELEFQARHDVLTGLLNRREFERRLKDALKSAKEHGTEHVLLYIDLDQFKLVNDTCGHGAGDELLVQLTQSLQKYLRPADTFARLGGDEFGVLLQDCGLEKGQEIAQIIRQAVKQFQFMWDGRSFDVGASIGLVAVDERSVGLAQIMSAADVACYSAKENGRNRVRVYQDTDKDLQRREVEMDWATRISQSMEEGMLTLYYQEIVPVVPVPDDLHRHIEILVRIQDSRGQHVKPEAFLSSAERYNLMPLLDRWVVRNSFEWFQQSGHQHDLLMAINLSGLTLGDTEFVAYVIEMLRDYDVPPTSICFEITETAAIGNLGYAADFMRELKQVGCLFALDDFGSGLSSFAYLKALPVDYLKIDGTFVKNMMEDELDREMVRAINAIGHTMKLKTVAEFVTDQRMMAVLASLGVDYAQGFAMSKPRKLVQFGNSAKLPAAPIHPAPLALH